ncbi:O-antigen ligase family protein [Planomicrobium sp. YIM 101495]|uniref:O-antigen ligase family protein n=1 Tax=Planomicrobium sp. YIM 101495 TaxID=2665160 RepID=UPI0012B70E9F|nr:O-antigen ligase family protein [Planomicrobium sp. YIM 101495]MTD30767.1 hypothetical protein [Planomicrobium sp. YIM 101495]
MKNNTHNYSIKETNSLYTPSFLLSIIIGGYFFLSFYEGYLNGILGSSLLKYYIFALILMLLISYKSVYIRKYHILILAWFTIMVASILWSPLGLSSTVKNHIFAYIGMIGLFIAFTAVNFNKQFTLLLVKVSLISSFSLATLSIFFSEAYAGVEQRQVLTLFGVQIDPNNLAAFHLVGFTIAVYYLIFEKKYKLFYLIILSINFLAILMTGSRGGLLSLTLVFLTSMIISFFLGNIKVLLKQYTAVIIIIFSGFFLTMKFLSISIRERLFNFNSYEDGSHRSIIWKVTWERIKENLFFGNGWGNSPVVVHNTFLNMLNDVGLVGVSLFLFIFILLLLKIFRTKSYLALLILIAGTAPSFFIDAINKRFFWNAIILAFILVNSSGVIKQKK